ncbi:MAG: hypothetical protein QM602_00170, partial [Microbacterium sp.]
GGFAAAAGLPAPAVAAPVDAPAVAAPADVVAAPGGAAIQAAEYAPARSESLFVAITPCRMIDTRAGVGVFGTRFTADAARSYTVTSSGLYPSQGGKSGGCGIPTSATAIAATVIAVNPTAKGAIRAWAYGGTAPTANVLNYGTTTASSGATIGITPNSVAGLTIKNLDASTHVVIDVTGYYAPQMHGKVSADGTAATGSSRIVSAVRVSQGHYTVTFDQDITYCTPIASGYEFGDYASALTRGGTAVSVYTWLLSSNGQASLYDRPFYISVEC